MFVSRRGGFVTGPRGGSIRGPRGGFVRDSNGGPSEVLEEVPFRVLEEAASEEATSKVLRRLNQGSYRRLRHTFVSRRGGFVTCP